MATKLTYTIIPPTDVAECSVSLDPDDVSRATIKIEVRNETGEPVAVDHIVLRVAAGGGADHLTANPASITPVAVDSGRWQLTTPEEPGVFRARPIGPAAFAAASEDTELDTTRFVLYDIEVVDVEGLTLLTVEEWETEDGPPQQVQLQVRKVYPALRIDEFVATPYSIDAGEPVDLSWATTAADDVQILDPLGRALIANPTDPALRDGSLSGLQPQTTGNYTLIARRGGATATRQVAVTVRDRLVLRRLEGDDGEETGHCMVRVNRSGNVVLSGPERFRLVGDLAVTGRISGNGSVPTGVIVMWSGRIEQIPEEWALCDGSRGTPDLRDRFVLGAGRAYRRGASGGEEEVSLETKHLARHTHTASCDRTPDVGSDLAVLHHGTSGSLQTVKNSDRGIKVKYADTYHSHDITVRSAGEGEPHPNMPPYYALAFIMKL